MACGWGGSGVCGPWLGDLLWGMLCWCWDGHVLILVHLQIDPSGWKAGLHLRCGSPSLCDSTVSHTEDQPGCSYKGKLNWRRVQEGKGSSPRQLDVARGQNDRWQKCCHSDLVTHVLEQNIIPVSQWVSLWRRRHYANSAGSICLWYSQTPGRHSLQSTMHDDKTDWIQKSLYRHKIWWWWWWCTS